MSRRKDEFVVFNYFDPCLCYFIKTIRAGCQICPLCDSTVDEVIERVRKYARINFLTNSYKYSLKTSARLALESACELEICFEQEYYPVARSVAEFETHGTYIYRLFTKASFNKSFRASICPELELKMLINDLSRVTRFIKPIRLIKST